MGNEFSLPKKLQFKIVDIKNDAIRALNEAEQQDFYLEECHDDRANSLARKDLTYTPNTIHLRDVKYAYSFLEGIIKSVPIRLLSDLEEVKIIQLMPSADGGMPHTRPGNIICYPNFSQIFSKNTLIHELWHIHQRNFKDMWFKTFKRLGWKLWEGTLPEQLENNRRINPDTIDCPLWIFQDTWIPIPIFSDISRPSVNNVEIWFYNPNKQYHIKRVPTEIEFYFSGLPSTAYEHPREITAYMLAEPEKYKNTLGFKHLIEEIGEIAILQYENKHN